MTESGGGRNVEFSNRMFLQDEEEEIEDQHGTFSLEEMQPTTNFVNPVYETMFLVGFPLTFYGFLILGIKVFSCKTMIFEILDNPLGIVCWLRGHNTFLTPTKSSR